MPSSRVLSGGALVAEAVTLEVLCDAFAGDAAPLGFLGDVFVEEAVTLDVPRDAFAGEVVTLDASRGTFAGEAVTLDAVCDALAGEAVLSGHWSSHLPNRCAACWYTGLFDGSDFFLSRSDASNCCSASLP